MYTRQTQMTAGVSGPQSESTITLGTVVDTSDPQQMGRIRVCCHSWNDDPTNVESLPWCRYVTPFGGSLGSGTRGPEMDQSQGRVAYGFWALPKVGSLAVVACVEGRRSERVWLGCVYDQFEPHSMPHGRYSFEDHPKLPSETTKPVGPFSTAEQFINPFYKNAREAFPGDADNNIEWQTRIADYTVAATDIENLPTTTSYVQDDKDVTYKKWTSRQGYALSRVEPDRQKTHTGKNYDPQTYSWTTPGFHAISMDDRIENCRVRIRSSAGHQVILDDTNERIYISTAKGHNWIEIDQAGNIHMFTDKRVNIRAKKDINFTTDETFRVHAKKGIHLYSDDEMRIHVKKDMHTKVEQNIRTHSSQGTFWLADQEYHVKTASSMYLEAAATIHEKSGSELNLTSGGTTNILAGGNITATGSRIDLNGPAAASATAATQPGELPAMWTNFVPNHEPYGRVMTKNDYTHAPEVPYQDEKNGQIERGTAVPRGKYWRR
jgi:hypothetical protein